MKLLKNTFIIMLLFSMVFNLSSCKKDIEPTSGDIKLTVIEYGSNNPIKNVAVGLLKRTPNSGLGAASYSVITTANTDENGMVSFGAYNDWSQLYIDVQHPNYYDISTISVTQLVKDQRLIKLSGVSYVSVRFINVNNKDKPETVLGYYFDPYSGGGSMPPTISAIDTLYNIFLIPALHNTNVVYSLFQDDNERNNGNPYLRSKKVPFTTAQTNDTIYLTVNY